MQADRSKKLIAAIQTCRRKVAGLAEDDAWRDFLAAVTGGRSLTAMTVPQLGKVIDALHARGAPRTAPRRGASRFADSRQVRMIRGLWVELAGLAGGVEDASEAALNAFITRQTGQDIGALSPADAARVIEALKVWRRRCLPDAGA